MTKTGVDYNTEYLTEVLIWHSVGFCQVEVYFKKCFEVRKIWLPFFSCQSLLLGTNVPNDLTTLKLLLKHNTV